MGTRAAEHSREANCRDFVGFLGSDKVTSAPYLAGCFRLGIHATGNSSQTPLITRKLVYNLRRLVDDTPMTSYLYGKAYHK